MTSLVTAPRIYCIPATAAPVVAVIRRGPAKWFQLGRWDLARPSYEPGSWFRGNLFPQRCDLSPDGWWFSYFALSSGRSEWAAGRTYCAISRLPWLTALATWKQDGTWTRGYHFTDGGNWEVGEPTIGDVRPCRARYGMAVTRPSQFAVERRRGWVESSDTPPRRPNDVWDERRVVAMEKARPGRPQWRLRVQGLYAAFRASAELWNPAESSTTVVHGEKQHEMTDAQWADWSSDGRLLVAARDGKLQMREEWDAPPVFQEDLAALEPDPKPAPPEARHW